MTENMITVALIVGDPVTKACSIDGHPRSTVTFKPVTPHRVDGGHRDTSMDVLSDGTV